MNRPYWLDFFYIIACTAPPILVAVVVSRMAGLSGVVGLAAFLGILIVAVMLWFAILVLWSRFSQSDTESNGENGT